MFTRTSLGPCRRKEEEPHLTSPKLTSGPSGDAWRVLVQVSGAVRRNLALHLLTTRENSYALSAASPQRPKFQGFNQFCSPRTAVTLSRRRIFFHLEAHLTPYSDCDCDSDCDSRWVSLRLDPESSHPGTPGPGPMEGQGTTAAAYPTWRALF